MVHYSPKVADRLNRTYTCESGLALAWNGGCPVLRRADFRPDKGDERTRCRDGVFLLCVSTVEPDARARGAAHIPYTFPKWHRAHFRTTCVFIVPKGRKIFLIILLFNCRYRKIGLGRTWSHPICHGRPAGGWPPHMEMDIRHEHHGR